MIIENEGQSHPTLPAAAPNFLDFTRSQINSFFEGIEPYRSAYAGLERFSYLAVRDGDKWTLAQGALALSPTPNVPETTVFETENVRAGAFFLTEASVTVEHFIDRAINGEILTPSGILSFPPSVGGSYISHLEPFHPAGLQNQSRLSAITIRGDRSLAHLHFQKLNWELMAAFTPYDGIKELLSELFLNPMQEISTIELFAGSVCSVDSRSTNKDGNAEIICRLPPSLDRTKFRLGYRVIHENKVVGRSSISGDGLRWFVEENIGYLTTELSVPKSAIIYCVTSYGGVAQTYYLVTNPKSLSNPRRVTFEAIDPSLEYVREIVEKAGQRGYDARDFEKAVAWIAWMLGFNTAHLGGSARMQEAADILVTTPDGHFALIECTTGNLNADKKLPLLHARAQRVRRALDGSHNNHVRVTPVIVTNMLKADIGPELDRAKEFGISVISRERLLELLDRSVWPLPEAIYAEAFQD